MVIEIVIVSFLCSGMAQNVKQKMIRHEYNPVTDTLFFYYISKSLKAARTPECVYIFGRNQNEWVNE